MRSAYRCLDYTTYCGQAVHLRAINRLRSCFLFCLTTAHGDICLNTIAHYSLLECARYRRSLLEGILSMEAVDLQVLPLLFFGSRQSLAGETLQSATFTAIAPRDQPLKYYYGPPP